MKKKLFHLITVLFACYAFQSCAQAGNSKQVQNVFSTPDSMQTTMNKQDTAIFGAGCFWCVEAVYQSLNGVLKVTSGYSGGTTVNPTYKQVCSGTTGHAEVCEVIYDLSVISYKDLLEAFWSAHDPTTLNRQGNDVGTQYRSVIFYSNDEQKMLAEEYKKKLNDNHAFAKPVVTAIEPFTIFYAAEDYHQDYFELNGHEPYCQIVIAPKLEHFKEVFHDKLKPELK